MPPRNVVEDLKGAEDMMKRGITGIDVVRHLQIRLQRRSTKDIEYVETKGSWGIICILRQ